MSEKVRVWVRKFEAWRRKGWGYGEGVAWEREGVAWERKVGAWKRKVWWYGEGVA